MEIFLIKKLVQYMIYNVYNVSTYAEVLQEENIMFFTKNL